MLLKQIFFCFKLNFFLSNFNYFKYFNFFRNYNLYNYTKKNFNFYINSYTKINFFFKIRKNNLYVYNNLFKGLSVFNEFNLNFNKFHKKSNFLKKFFKFKNLFFKKLDYVQINFVNFVNFYFIFVFIDFINFFIYIFFFPFFMNNLFLQKNKLFRNLYEVVFNNFCLFKFINNNFLFIFNNNYLDFFKFNLFYFKNLVYNNQFPLFFLKNNFVFFKKFNIKKKYNFVNFINLKILDFLEFFFKKNFFIKIHTDKIFNNNNILYLYKKYNNNFFRIKKNLLLNEFLYIIYVSFFNKDLIFLKNWIKFLFFNLELQFHKKFFNIFNEIISDNFDYFRNLFKIKGFYCCVKGKIGLTGNSKKKIFLIKRGKLNLSSKKIKIDNQKFFLKTDSGVIGLNLILSYK